MKTVVITEFGAKADGSLCTEYIQNAIDECFKSGGGTVVIPEGRFLIGSIRLRSNITLYLKEGAYLEGSRNPLDYMDFLDDEIEPVKDDYKTNEVWKSVAERTSFDFLKKPAGRWANAMIKAIDAENIAIIGEKNSQIDGRDCFDEIGEEHYRGPHAICMHYCKNIKMSGYTIRNSANWAHALFWCKDIKIDNVDVIAGHDGVHITTCDNTEITNSRFYTGDDCIAGIDNIDTLVENCELNSACSAFRFGGTNLLVNNCKIYGPAKYLFRGSLTDEEKRNGKLTEENTSHRFNMLSLYTYYSDFTRDIREIPGNIVIKNCAVENADRFLHYNFSGNEPWQSNKPMNDVTFENITAKGVNMPLTAYGSEEAKHCVTIKDCDIEFNDEAENVPFIQAAFFKKICIENVNIKNSPGAPLIKKWSDGEIVIENVNACGKEIVDADEEFYTQWI